MIEEDEDHVGCNGEGCPNKCALGVDCGHVEEAGGGCGGVGHDVGGVVHGYIAQMERKKENRCRSFHKQDSVPRPRSRALSHSRHAVRSCPNWHKTAIRFHRIRCTICFTSPKTKETTPAGRGHACCLFVVNVMLNFKSASCSDKKGSFWQFGAASLNRDAFHWVHKGQPEARDFTKGAERKGQLFRFT